MVYCWIYMLCCCVLFFKQKTAYGVGSSDWSSDVCSSDLVILARLGAGGNRINRGGSHYGAVIKSSLRGAWGGGPCEAWWRGNSEVVPHSPPPRFARSPSDRKSVV